MEFKSARIAQNVPPDGRIVRNGRRIIVEGCAVHRQGGMLTY